MLELAASGAKVLHLRSVEYARRHNIPIHVRSSFSTLEGTTVTGSINDPEFRGGQHGSTDHRRRRPRPQRGQDHRRRRPRQGRRGGRDLQRARRRPDQPRHDRAERVGRRHEPHRHLLHAAAHRRPDRDGDPRRAQGPGRLRVAALRRQDRQGLADRRRHALAPGHLREVLHRARRGRRQHRDDLDLGDPDLGDRRRGRRRRRRPGRRTRRSTSTPTRSRQSSTAAPAAESTRGARRAPEGSTL